jgi:hypothetical protein
MKFNVPGGAKLALAKNVVTSKVARQALVAQKHSPTLLFGAGVIGVVTSTVWACKATLELETLLMDNAQQRGRVDEALEISRIDGDDKYTEKNAQRDRAVLKVRAAVSLINLYRGPLALGALSICALGGSHVILNNRNAGLVAAYATLDKGFSEYRARVAEEFGTDRELELRHGVKEVEVAVDTENGTEVQVQRQAIGGSIYARWFDETNRNFNKYRPELNRFTVQCQQQYANDQLKARGHIFLNEVYDMLGMDRTKEGAVVGWVKGVGNDYVDFGVFQGDLQAAKEFVLGQNGAILLDFNVCGPIYDKI